MLELLLWAAVLVVSLTFLVKGADFFIEGTEEIGLSWGLSPFVIGVFLVGIGTSLPEFAGAVAALLAGTTEIITANAIGSNIANILLVIGLTSVIAGRLTITKNLLDIEIPLFATATILFIGVALDGRVTFLESALLASGFVVYLIYTFRGHGELAISTEEEIKKLEEKKPILIGSYIYTFVGLIGIVLGARFLISSVIEIATILEVSPGVISLTAVALGTSFPELFVSLQAVRKGKIDTAIGNIFGSNAFNILFTIGIPGLFSTLLLDEQTWSLGLPILAAASFLFFTSNLSKTIYKWEGWMFLLLYAFFILKLMGF